MARSGVYRLQASLDRGLKASSTPYGIKAPTVEGIRNAAQEQMKDYRMKQPASKYRGPINNRRLPLKRGGSMV